MLLLLQVRAMLSCPSKYAPSKTLAPLDFNTFGFAPQVCYIGCYNMQLMLLNETAPVWEMAFHSSMQYFCKMLQHFVDHKCSAARNFTPNFSLVFTVCHCELPAVQVLTDLGITPDAMPLALITSNEHESVS
jgi:hypothetical protein